MGLSCVLPTSPYFLGPLTYWLRELPNSISSFLKSPTYLLLLPSQLITLTPASRRKQAIGRKLPETPATILTNRSISEPVWFPYLCNLDELSMLLLKYIPASHSSDLFEDITQAISPFFTIFLPLYDIIHISKFFRFQWTKKKPLQFS